MPLPGRRYLKMNGIGNQIVVLDLLEGGHRLSAGETRSIAVHEPFDQLMVLEPSRTPGTDALLRIYNRDGSLAGACGNGTRCVAWMLMPRLGRSHLVLETQGGLVTAWRSGQDTSTDTFTVDMGVPRFGWADIPLAEPFADTRYVELQIGPIDAPVLHSPAVVSMGNPHAVFWVDRDPDSYNLGRFGPLLENHPLFPERANISLAQVLERGTPDHGAPGHIRLRVWERGAGLTRACGSAACAALVCAARLRRTGRVATVSLPGGDLLIEWREDGHVLMTGPVEFEHEGTIEADWLTEPSSPAA